MCRRIPQHYRQTPLGPRRRVIRRCAEDSRSACMIPFLARAVIRPERNLLKIENIKVLMYSGTHILKSKNKKTPLYQLRAWIRRTLTEELPLDQKLSKKHRITKTDKSAIWEGRIFFLEELLFYCRLISLQSACNEKAN